MSRLLLLSGGLDSSSIAAWIRPDHCLGVNYGQRAAMAELRAATAIAQHLDLPFDHITVDASAVGAGVMAGCPSTTGPSAEWWPFRNQFLITTAAAWGVTRGHTEVLVGTVAGDGDRHADGREEFYDTISGLLRLQEGGLTVSAPAIHLAADELIKVAEIDDAALGWTHSCHLGDVPCGHCPGCVRRTSVLLAAGRLQ